MNCANERSWDLESQTHSDQFSPVHQNSTNLNEYLVVVRMNRQLVKVVRPQGKIITFGRSSRCNIILPDPRFSRTAGELILGPVPMMKWTKHRKKSDALVSIEPGKPYRFRPYTLTVMEPGDFLFNRYNNNDGCLVPMIKPVLLMMAILAIVSMIFLRSDMTDKVAINKTERKILAVASEKKVKEITHKSEDIKEDHIMETPTLLLSESSHEKLITVPKNTSFDSAPVSKKKEKMGTNLRGPIEKNRKVLTMPAGEFQEMIKTALQLVEQENLVTAGRTLSPLLPHMDNDQRALIVNTIDPLIEAIFKKAYMIKFYEPERAGSILRSIIESQLEFLPSYQKARRLLEEERPGH